MNKASQSPPRPHASQKEKKKDLKQNEKALIYVKKMNDVLVVFLYSVQDTKRNIYEYDGWDYWRRYKRTQ